jgi:hypothetical protein
MNRTILSIATAALLMLGACNKKSENPPPSPGASGTMAGSGSAAPAAGSGSAAPAAGSGSAAPAAGSGSAVPAAGSGSAAPAAGSGSAAAASVDVPTEEDFEDDAKAKITDKNVETQVGAIEKQLAPDTK